MVGKEQTQELFGGVSIKKLLSKWRAKELPQVQNSVFFSFALSTFARTAWFWSQDVWKCNGLHVWSWCIFRRVKQQMRWIRQGGADSSKSIRYFCGRWNHVKPLSGIHSSQVMEFSRRNGSLVINGFINIPQDGATFQEFEGFTVWRYINIICTLINIVSTDPTQVRLWDHDFHRDYIKNDMFPHEFKCWR